MTRVQYECIFCGRAFAQTPDRVIACVAIENPSRPVYFCSQWHHQRYDSGEQEIRAGGNTGDEEAHR